MPTIPAKNVAVLNTHPARAGDASWTVAGYFRAKKVYRIVVFGGTGSGKTCLLAALGMPGREHPAGLSCVRQDRLPGMPPGGMTAGGTTLENLRQDPIQAFIRADQWLSEAESRLAAGVQPEGNPANLPPLLAVFVFSAPDRGEVTVEVVDFPGELIRANTANHEQQATLLGFMNGLDGIVLLAEAAYPGKPARDFSEMLRAFDAMTETHRIGVRRELPIAVVYNKWDRRGRREACQEERARELEAQLDESPDHKQVWDKARAVGLASKFAVSAFGVHEGDAGSERPAGVLRSYGLEDPFMWVCGESDRLAYERVTKQTNDLRWYNLLQIRSYARAVEAAGEIPHRLHLESKSHLEAVGLLKKLRREANAQRLLCGLILVSVLGTGVYGGWTVIERLQQRFAEAAVARDEEFWDQLKAAPDAVRSEMLDRYVREFPDGRHKAECERMLAEKKDRERQSEVRRDREQKAIDRRERVARVSGSLTAARAKQNDSAILEVRKEYRDLPQLEIGVETEADVVERKHLGEEIDETLAAVTKDVEVKRQRAEWARLKREIDKSIDTLDFRIAASQLRASAIPLAEVKEFKEDFGQAVLNAAQRKAQADIARKSWDDSIGKLEAGRDDKDVIALIKDPMIRRQIDGLVKQLKEAKDKALYDDFFNVRTKPNAATYLRDAPLKTMRQPVEKFVAWEEARHLERKLGVRVVIEWGTWANEIDTDVTVDVRRNGQDSPWINVATEKVKAMAKGKSEPIQSNEFDCVPKEQLDIRVKIARTPGTYIFSTQLIAELTVEGKTAENFVKEHNAKMVQTKGTDRGATALIVISNLPSEPVIGPWKDDK